MGYTHNSLIGEPHIGCPEARSDGLAAGKIFSAAQSLGRLFSLGWFGNSKLLDWGPMQHVTSIHQFS